MNFFFLFVSIYSFQFSPEHEIQILRAGCFHHDEASINTDYSWMALSSIPGSDEEYEITKVKIKVTSCYDPIFDEGNKNTGVKISLEDSTQFPVIIVGGVKFKEKKIKSDKKNFKTIFPGETLRVYTSDFDNQYRLHGYGDVSSVSDNRFEPLVKNYRVVLEKVHVRETDPYQSQVIISDMQFGGEENQPSLVWYGDIDDDDIPDFLFNLTNHYNVSHFALYLSSKAEGTNLVKLVAEWRTTGC